MASRLLHPLCGCNPGPKLGQIQEDGEQSTLSLHLLADSLCWCYAAFLFGTTTTLTNWDRLMGRAGSGLTAEWPGVLCGADQADD
ncbi:MAG: hypothetical protein ABSF28_24170 [Terracidiphilus sp.]|jgi:hypothetical protein